MTGKPIRLGGAQNFVEFGFLERGASGTPDEGNLRLGITASSDGFTGRYDAVWIAADEWRGFLASLRQLERERIGEASIRSMSPDEFELHLRIVTRGGSLAAYGRLSRYHFSHPSGTTARSSVEYHFPIDASMLRSVVDSIASLPE
jgi:hypothetical protein